jgi:hypothetical protein
MGLTFETLVEKDLGILVTNDFKWDQHIIKMCSVATFAAKSIFKCFKHKSPSTIGMIYKSLIRLKLEYANVIWSPLLQKHKDMFEKVQRRCTKLGSLTNFSYQDRLIKLGLTTLETRRRRRRVDLVQISKYVKGFNTLNYFDPPKFLNNKTRSHKYNFERDKPYKLHEARSSYLINRVASEWNELSPNVVDAFSVDDFKRKIDELKQFQIGC